MKFEACGSRMLEETANKSFAPLMLSAASACLLQAGFERADIGGTRIDAGKPCVLIGIRGKASLITNAGFKAELGAHLMNSAKYAGIDIFSGAVFGRNSVRFEANELFLDAFAHAAEGKYRHSVPDSVSIPRRGIAADAEASPYVRSRLYAYSKSGAEWKYTKISKNALFRCLCLFSFEGSELEAMLPSAVRSALKACDEGSVGGGYSLAMASALKYAEEASLNNLYVKE